MKKKIMILILSSLFLMPSIAKAETVSTNLEETLAAELNVFKNVTAYATETNTIQAADLSDYVENDENKINLYLFRGSSCSHCYEATAFIASMVADYGQYFNVVSYEVWGNEDNANLMTKVATALGDSTDSVPYIIIGDQSFVGYKTSMNNSLISAITNAYESEEHYNVMDHLDEITNNTDDNSTTDDTTKTTTSKADILVPFITIGGMTAIAFYFFMRKKESH